MLVEETEKNRTPSDLHRTKNKSPSAQDRKRRRRRLVASFGAELLHLEQCAHRRLVSTRVLAAQDDIGNLVHLTTDGNATEEEKLLSRVD